MGKPRKVRQKARKNPRLINNKKGRKYTTAELTRILLHRDDRIRRLESIIYYYQEWSKKSVNITACRLRRMVRRTVANEIWLFNGSYFDQGIFEYSMAAHIFYRISMKMRPFYQIRTGIRPTATRTGMPAAAIVRRSYGEESLCEKVS